MSLASWSRVDTGHFDFNRPGGLHGIFGNANASTAPADWREWLEALFPNYVVSGFAPHHEEFWEWAWSVEQGEAPRPFVGIWPRGGGKSTGAELAAAAFGLRGQRNYCLYVRDTQDRADDSVSNVGSLFETEGVARHYPEHADRDVNKYGASKGWRRNRLRTAGGYTVDALGLDVAGRGVKLEEHRPDVIIFDDIDGRHDSLKATEKKIATITDSLLPAGTDDTTVLAIQNLIIPHGIFSRLSDGRANFLTRRIVSGPHPAIVGMETEKERDETGALRDIITGGEPTWDGQGIESCQKRVDLFGLSSFVRECQHNVQDREGALWTQSLLNETRRGDHPPLKRVVVGVDPSGGGDEIGIIVCGVGHDNHGYVLADYSQPGSLGPANWGRKARDACHDWEADRIVAEKNFGGDMVASNIRSVEARLPVKMVSASRGKDVRAEPIATLYEEDQRVHHVGTLDALETEMRSWAPGDADSPNRMDALVWALTELMLGSRKAEVYAF